jgi:release factor glutamine methyltransferase
MLVKEALNSSIELLKKRQISEPESSAEVLLGYALGVERTRLRTVLGEEIPGEVIPNFQKMIARRLKKEPVWRIIGSVEFYGNYFSVSPKVLVPRPETEFLIESVLKALEGSHLEHPRVLELGTGSGAISISLAKNFGRARYFASDISAEALDVAINNAGSLGASEQIEFRVGDLFNPWEGEKFDLVVANLPYIPINERHIIPKEVSEYDPEIALFGGKDGIDLYKKMFLEMPNFLNEPGLSVVEVGYHQGDLLTKYLEKIAPKVQTSFWKDYGGEDRLFYYKSGII